MSEVEEPVLKLPKNEVVTEYAVAIPRLKDGRELESLIPCFDKKEAEECVDSFNASGIYAEIVTRTVSEWALDSRGTSS